MCLRRRCAAVLQKLSRVSQKTAVGVIHRRQGFVRAWRSIAQTHKAILPTGIAHLGGQTIAFGHQKESKLDHFL